MRISFSTATAMLAATMTLGSAIPASAACTRLAFSVNDYGKDGPTKDAKSLLDKYVANWAKEKGIAKYRTGTKDVKCELFLNLIVFDEHTCRAEATVCWDGAPVTPAVKSAAAPAEGPPAKKEAVAAPAKNEVGTKSAAGPLSRAKRPAAGTAAVEATPVAVPAAAPAEIAPVAPAARAAAVPAAPAALETGTLPAAVAKPVTVAPAANPAAKAAAATPIADQALAAAEKAAAAAERAAAAAERAAAAAAAAEKANPAAAAKP
jgi:hypothetical protein